MISNPRIVLSVSGVFLALALAAAPAPPPAERLWQAAPDDVFLQEIGQKIPTPQPVTALAWHRGQLFCVMEGKLFGLANERLQPIPNAPTSIRRLRSLGDSLWAATDGGVHRHATEGWERISDERIVDFCLHQGAVYAASRHALFRFETGRFIDIRPADGYLSTDTTVIMEDFSQVLADPVQIGPIQRVASYSGTLYLLRDAGLALMDGRTFVPDPIDWGALPSPVTRDLLAHGGRLVVATDRGLGVLRGMAMHSVRASEGLCYEDVTCLARGFGGDLWVGTTQGAIRMTNGEFHYFGADHWLPANSVHDITVADKVAYIATDAGLGVIRYQPFTLRQKAAFFERELEAWDFKRLGFVHKLHWSDREDGWVREISDNDGGHTAHYLAAMSFKYAATQDTAAQRQAAEAFHAMAWLGDICPNPGFIARAIWSVQGDRGERSTRGSGGLPAKWHPTPDGHWLWKGDTSSDEVSAHFFAVSLFHDLAATGPEKQRAARHLSRLASHILENGWVLRDLDGRPTRWGRWDTNYLLTPYGFEARGLNGMEAQTYMHTAFALTGDPRFQRGLDQLLAWRYHTYTVRQRLTFPPDSVVPWDDELAFFCYYPLLRYTTNPELRSIYLRSLERTWEVVRPQHLPFFNFVYGAFTGNDCDVHHAVRHLREWSLDLVNHNYRNSHRQDLVPSLPVRLYGGGKRTISPRESEAKMDIRSPLQYDGGENSRAVTPPIGWLADYWMGRFYGFIQPPAEGDHSATPLPPLAPHHPRALPYTGPQRPPPPQ